jgi:hypothetical protein
VGLFAVPEVTNAGMDFGIDLLLLFGGGVIGLVWSVYSVAVPGVFRSRVEVCDSRWGAGNAPKMLVNQL